MSDTLASLRRKIGGAGDLESVVRSMKALAAASIGQYEKSVLALADYYRAVELGLIACLRQRGKETTETRPRLKPRKSNRCHRLWLGSGAGRSVQRCAGGVL